jgi:BioD-like phosphotransacetylase family protein
MFIWLILVLLFSAIFTPMFGQKTYQDLSKDEKTVLLQRIQDSYFALHKKEIHVTNLNIFLEQHNPTCEWSGVELKIKKRIIKLYSISRTYTTQIFNL